MIYLEKSNPLAIDNQTKLIIGFVLKYLHFLLNDGSKINFDLFGEITLPLLQICVGLLSELLFDFFNSNWIGHIMKNQLNSIYREDIRDDFKK